MFTYGLEDVGKPKAEVAAKRVMERVSGVNIVPHFCRIEDKELEFYSEFSIIVLGLDSIEARSYINAVACGFLEYDSNDNPQEQTMKPMVDGGTEGFKGHARVILPGMTPCFECTIWLFPPQVKFPLCTLAETPRTAAHCIEYAHLIKWDEVHSGKSFDPDNPEHMQWVYLEAAKRAELFGIPGVTYSLTQGVVKNIIPAIASTNAIISAACALETLKIASGCSKTLSNYLTYNGVEGLHTKVTEFVKDKDCLVCGPGILIELDTSVTLKMFIDLVEDHPKLLVSGASVTHRGKNLYMQAPPVLEEMTRSNLSLPLFELMDKFPKGVVHVTGTAGKGDNRQSCLRKLRVAFKGVDGITDTDMAGGA
ncbi:NEDD8-activating enzyme E1 catalytic subunit isoform X2 [Cynara cardunculus var. scolymus]|uniref:NEDD8-activating enzyme E1 catalytic subunit isoform X2 n=1 Tax=Cynara cardunculus var. scolymus TaxID=59895 RepID=UPI000D62F931|nr:NEDD8-activating enzyme E1 catalytic subunit isoform X2 [Cynara cardunculus var. scolymus]